MHAGQLCVTHFDAEIATGNQEDVGGFEDGIDLFDRLRPFELRHDKPLAARCPEQLARLRHVVCIANK